MGVQGIDDNPDGMKVTYVPRPGRVARKAW